MKEYVAKHAVNIRTIDPNDTTFDDLRTIGDAIGDSQIVMLGEQGHGDGSTYLAKTRIIKYLHEHKGFNVLAFECDFFALNKGWDNLKKDKSFIDPFITRNIYLPWSICSDCSDLFYNYIPSTAQSSHPIVLTGFDCHLQERYSLDNLVNMLDSMFKNEDLSIVHQKNYLSDLQLIKSSFAWWQNQPDDVKPVERYLTLMDTIKNMLGSKHLPENNIWPVVIDNLIEQGNDFKDGFLLGRQVVNKRDLQMALNLAWLTETKFKGQKIIVWSANSHIARSLRQIEDTLFKSARPMTEVFNGLVKKKIYVMGFTSYKGTAQRIFRQPYSFEQKNNDNLESWININKFNYAFLDFEKYNSTISGQQQNFSMATLGHISVAAPWNKMFDGIFYLYDMEPCVVMQRASE
ncbi:MAG TPA: erythromycin esterase family protein [Candidatus Babeliaceae bacterium]|nr:erythromycin esterase family protein [Candidatus Babeliaceae bacterium]